METLLPKKIIDDLIKRHDCHTIILYGSYARGEATATSDYDIIAIREHGEFERDCRIIDGHFLDAFIYSEEMIEAPDASMLRIKDGIVLCQKEAIGSKLLIKIKALFQKGAPITPVWEKQEILVWIAKMLQRAQQIDIEGNFRRHWLLHDLLECYFKLRDQWFLGAKESFKWLRQNDAETYAAFDKALQADAPLSKIEILAKRVIPTI